MVVKIGIIGCGAITRRAFLPGFAKPGSPEALKANPYYQHYGCENAEVIALADVETEKAAALAEEFHVPKVFGDWRELLEINELQAVCINTPNYLHCEMTIAAAEAGKHIMVEKPMASTIDEAQAMIDAANKNNVFLMVDQTQRFWPMHEIASNIIKSGMIGEIFSVRGRMAHAGPEFWSKDSKWFFKKDQAVHGAMFDIGIHKIDLIRFICGMDFIEVSAFTDTLDKRVEVEDNAIALLRFENRALCVLEASWTCNPNENTTFIYGKYGNLKIGYSAEDPIFVEFHVPETALNRDIPPGSIKPGKYVPNIPKESQLGGPWQHFVDSIIEGKQPTPTGTDALKSLEIALGVFKSSEQGRVIKLPFNR